MGKNNLGLVEYVKAMVGNPYWWGTFGQFGTKQLYDQKKFQYPSAYQWEYHDWMDSMKVHDCSGLIKGYLWSTINSTPIYNASQDQSAAGFYNLSTIRGHISDMPELPGILIFYGNLGHVGVYIGNGKVVQAANVRDGVIETDVRSDNNWTYWAKCPFIDYVIDSGNNSTEAKDATELLRTIRNTLLNIVDLIDEFK